MEEEAYQAAAAGSDAQRRRTPHLRVPVPETDRRRRRPSPSEPDFDVLLPDLEIEVVGIEAPPPRKRARIPASIQGLLQEVTTAASGDDECAICLQDLFHVQEQEQEYKLRAMPCSHIFHQHCIFEWLSRKTVCPLCRHQLMMPTTPAKEDEEEEEQLLPERTRITTRMGVTATNFDNDEAHIASLGDSVIVIEVPEVDWEGDRERARIAWAVIEPLMRGWWPPANRTQT